MKQLGILGPRGTHSEEAAIYLQKFLPEKIELVNYSEIFEVLNAVEKNEIDFGFVPVENSLEGSINITLDILARSNHLKIIRELVWHVHNHLMTKPETLPQDIKKIFSHAQPISQCRKFLQNNFPHAEIINTPSTARAAEIVAESNFSEGFAAICTKRAGELNGLKNISSEVQDNLENCTRFFEICHAEKNFDVEKIHGDKVLIICQIDGSRAGALCGVLEEFAFRGVNMTRIESRPNRTKLGEYIFFFDLETLHDKKILNEAIEAVRKKSIWLKNLGEFPVIVAE